MMVPEEFMSLIKYAETVRNIKDVPAKPKPCLNVVAIGGVGTGKTGMIRAYGDMLLEKQFISTAPVFIDCASAVSSGQLGRVVNTKLALAAGTGMVILDNAHLLHGQPFNAAAILQSRKDNGAVIALVGERDGIEKLLRENPDLGLQFPTIMDADNRAAQRRQDELRQNIADATVLSADIKAMKVLQIIKPVV